MTPRSTVRLQLNSRFTLIDAARHVPYYASLGISHLYLSPVSCARPDSTHGYDVIDHGRVDLQLGGEGALTALAQTVQRHDMGLIVDIVPNHMAADPANPWWHSVLQKGPESPYARWFDIEWETEQPELKGKVLLPVLADTYGEALEHGAVKLEHDGSSYVLDVHGMCLPLAVDSLQHHGDVVSVLDAHDPSTPQGRMALHAVLQRQYYRLAWWQCAPDQINWRRFFEISDLVGVRVERDDVFDAVHALPLRLFEQGLIDGLRIDHVDGLADPLSYCHRLHQALSGRVSRRPAGRQSDAPWLIVEKILACDELLDKRWDADGTTGYDCMDMLGAVMHDRIAEPSLTACWARLSRDGRSAEAWRRDARALMIDRHFCAERDTLLEKITQLANFSPGTRDTTRHSLGRALDQLLIAFSVYRTYSTLDQHSDHDVRYLDRARDEACRCLVSGRDLAGARALNVLADWLKGRGKNTKRLASDAAQTQLAYRALLAEVIRRFQQLTPPLAAKSLEDTVFYRYGRLLSRNEVGSDPVRFGITRSDFHRWIQQRATSSPRTMNATATHDHKRGEDVRARLAVISEVPHAWQDLSTRCLAALAQDATIDCGAPAAQCYMLLQTIVGAWPPGLQARDEAGMATFAGRLQQWQLKALREAKQKTSWFYPDESYEQEQIDRVGLLLSDPDSTSCRLIADFVSWIAPAGAMNSLAAVVLRCTLPGVPDLYQGTDLWDFSLVDPDNRQHVDLEIREAMLNDLQARVPPLSELLMDWHSGAIKQAIVARCLHLRRQQPDLFLNGSYEPLVSDGPLARHVIAFTRRLEGAQIVVLVSRLGCRAIQRTGETLALPVIPAGLWQQTRVLMRPGIAQGQWHDVLAGDTHDVTASGIQVGAVLTRLPVAVMVTP